MMRGKTKTSTTKLPEHKRERMIAAGRSPFCDDIFRDNSSEQPLRHETYNLSEDILSCMHLNTEFDSVAKMQISNHGQGILFLSNCA